MFRRLDATVIGACFLHWIPAVSEVFDGPQVARDGKTVRRARTAGQSAIRLLSEFAHGLGLTIGQIKTAEKSNASKAIPARLDALLRRAPRHP